MERKDPILRKNLTLLVSRFILLFLVSTASSGFSNEALTAIQSLALPGEAELIPLRAEIAKILGDETDVFSERSSQATRKAFELIFELQMRRIRDGDVLRKVKAIVSNSSLQQFECSVFNLYGLFEGSKYYPTREKIALSIPAKYENSLVALRHFIHEVEHAFQDQISMGIVGKNYSLGARSDVENMRVVMYAERGAMAWEWAALHLFPKNFLDGAAEQTKKDGLKSAEARALKNASLNRHKYLRAEWDAPRYGASQIRLSHRLSQFNFWGTCAAVGLLTFGLL